MEGSWIAATVIAFAMGGALGAAHFGSLWWVVRRLPSRRRPGLWLAGSTAARFAFTVPVLLLTLWHGWQSLVACLVGFLAARTVLVHAVRLER